MRLIDADALYEQTAEWEAKALEQVERYMGWETMDDPDYKQWQHWTAVLNERSAFKFDVADAPTVDAVPVIRCKDCIYCKQYNDVWQLPKRDGLLCINDNVDVNPNYYCSWAERREE